MTILDEIFAHKRLEVAEKRRQHPLAELERAAFSAGQGGDFTGALLEAAAVNRSPALIAEIKRASPSRGLLAPGLNPAALAQIYQDNGAAAISVLTDQRYFRGSLADLQAAAAAGLPRLRKDFLCDPYQVYESRLAGADAVLLIVAGLAPAELASLHALACTLGMAALVEVHNQDELELALSLDPALIGINNRNLHDFTVSLETGIQLIRHVPEGVCVVAESGIHSTADVQRMAEAGFNAILVGEALVTAADIPGQVRKLAWYG